jgi:hypothetical protein
MFVIEQKKNIQLNNKIRKIIILIHSFITNFWYLVVVELIFHCSFRQFEVQIKQYKDSSLTVFSKILQYYASRFTVQ